MQILRALWATEPARVIAVIAAIVVFLAAKLGVVIDEQDVGQALALIVPILLAGETVRSKVEPAVPVVEADNDVLLAERLGEVAP